jgi:hypothetical protein
MARPVTEDPQTLANVITGLGGTVIPGDTFRFDLPLEMVREVVPKINQLGVGVRKISERIEDHPTRLLTPQTVATLELYRPQEQNNDPLREAYFTRR